MSDKNNTNLSDEERETLVQIMRNNIIQTFQEMGNNTLVLNNPVLYAQYKDDYIVLMRHQNIQNRDKIRKLKLLINKVSGREEYSEEDLK